MTKKITVTISFLLLLFQLTTTVAFAANGSVKGKALDATTKEPLAFSNLFLLNTSWGASADQDGDYSITNIPPGKYTLRATYVGYKTIEVAIEIKSGGVTVQDFLLEPESIEGETVVITGQAEGQVQAINEQLQSIQVKNVVSAARIKELPDANAAESVGRLPGVSLIRTGGEGSKVVIRGLSPQFNQITIDGVEMTSNVASANNLTSTDKANADQEIAANTLGDRAADLSMISSNMLGGIEVIKAITPDMDATLIGGVVNFGMRKATKSRPTRIFEGSEYPLVEIISQGRYTELKNNKDDYLFTGSIEQRFFDESFGVFLQGTTEKRNLSSNELGASYNLLDKTHGDAGIPVLSSLTLTDVLRDRERNNFTAVFDYQHSTGEIGFMNLYSASKTDATNRSQEIINDGGAGDLWYSANDTRNETDVLTNLLSIKQDLPIFHVDLKLSHSYSESTNPEDLYFNFWQNDAGLANKGDLNKVHPSVLAKMAVPDPESTNMDIIQTSETFQRERSYTGSLDLQTEIRFSELLSSKIKFGGSYQYRKRSYNYNQYSGSQLYSGGAEIVSKMLSAFPQLNSQGGQLNTLVFADDYDYGEFLDGEYSMAYPSLDVDLMRQVIPFIKGVSTKEGYRLNILGSMVNDYDGNERKSAVYGMFTLKIGNEITIVPGVRYQNLTTEYTAVRGEVVPGGIQGGEATETQSHGYWLPMVHLRYEPLDWLQIHFAYTNTLNYPDYSTITPRYLIGQGFIAYNNYRLKPARSENFDLVASIYSNEIGLVSINGFKKTIQDLIFATRTYTSDFSAYPDLPQKTNQLYQFDTYINNPIDIDVYGIESDWQTRFWYLPDPFSGLVFSINYTHIFSEASYPKSEIIIEYDEEGNSVTTVNDTSYSTRLLNQPNDILNLSLGYDYEGFSARVSMLYMDNIFKRPDFWMQNRVNSDKFTRWDLSVKQTLPWYGIQIYFNLNNITGAMDVDINQKNSFPASEQHYGMTGDLGVRFRL
jgi:TonB-dependent receptor